MANTSNKEGQIQAQSTTVVIAVEGKRDNLEVLVSEIVTAAEFAIIASEQAGVPGLFEVFIEDRAEPLNSKDPLLQQLPEEFVVLHVATKGEIEVAFYFNGREARHQFKPSATILTLTNWAVGPSGLKLEGTPSDYQLKSSGEVLEPDLHLGQVTHGRKAVEFDLVLKVKAQG